MTNNIREIAYELAMILCAYFLLAHQRLVRINPSGGFSRLPQRVREYKTLIRRRKNE